MPTHPLSEPEVSELRMLLDRSPEGMNLREAEGFLTAVVSAPTLIPPSKWLALVMGELEFESMESAQRSYGLLMSFYNHIADEVNLEQPNRPDLALSDDELRQWCWGYLEAVRLDHAWTEDEEGLELLIPLHAWSAAPDEIENDGEILLSDIQSGEALQQARSMIPELVQASHRYWLKQRSTPAHIRAEATLPKVGRNDPCPCGSGQKFKRCCG